MPCVYKINDDDCINPPGHFKLSLTITTMVLVVCTAIIISMGQFKLNKIDLYENEGEDAENSAFAEVLNDQELMSEDPEPAIREEQRELLAILLELHNEIEFEDVEDDINAVPQDIEPMRHEDDEIGNDYDDYDFGDEEEDLLEEDGEEEEEDLAGEEEDETDAANDPADDGANDSADDADNEENTEENVTQNIGGQGGDENDKGGDGEGYDNNDNKGQNNDGTAKE